MTPKQQYLARLDQTFNWTQDAISAKVLGSKKDAVAFREMAGMIHHLGRLQRRLKHGNVRPRRRP